MCPTKRPVVYGFVASASKLELFLKKKNKEPRMDLFSEESSWPIKPHVLGHEAPPHAACPTTRNLF